MGKKIKKIINSKTFVIILTIILILLIGLVSTYAWLTWSSPANTTLTMTIGDLAAVTFDSGNDINTSPTPVYNYTDGEETTFTINHRGITSNMIVHTVTLNITSISQELRNESLKYKLVGSNNYVAEGDFSEASNGSSIVLVEDLDLELGLTDYSFYLYIDGNIENNSNMMNKNFVGNITITARLKVTPLSEFEYAIDEWDMRENGSIIMDIPEGSVLLTKYIGTDTGVNIPSTYTIGGVEYTPIVYGDGPNGEATFMHNTIITEVNFSPGVSFADFNNEETLRFNSLASLFLGCSSLFRVTGIPDSITDMEDTFSGCTSLVNAPKIPNSVTKLYNTFSNCASLVNAPEIPNSVTNMSYAFAECTSLVNAPEIPSSIVYMEGTFRGCTSLTGIIKINSSNIAASAYAYTHTLYNTSNAITVEVPAGSATYTSLNNNKPSNVTITTY